MIANLVDPRINHFAHPVYSHYYLKKGHVNLIVVQGILDSGLFAKNVFLIAMFVILTLNAKDAKIHFISLMIYVYNSVQSHIFRILLQENVWIALLIV